MNGLISAIAGSGIGTLVIVIIALIYVLYKRVSDLEEFKRETYDFIRLVQQQIRDLQVRDSQNRHRIAVNRQTPYEIRSPLDNPIQDENTDQDEKLQNRTPIKRRITLRK